MPKDKYFRIHADVRVVHGTQTFIVKAKSVQDAIRVFNKSSGDYETEEIEVQSLEEVDKSNVEEMSEEDAEAYLKDKDLNNFGG